MVNARITLDNGNGEPTVYVHALMASNKVGQMFDETPSMEVVTIKYSTGFVKTWERLP